MIAGVLRLSKNWIVARLMTVYIEGVRNVPVLLQILLWGAVFEETLPAPRAFRGEMPEASMLFDAIAATNRGFYFPGPVFGDGSVWVVGALIVGIIAAIWYGRIITKRQQETGEQMPSWWPKLLMILVPPILLQLIMGSPIGLEYPELKGFNFQGGIFARVSLVALWLALSLYTAAFIAENVRAGIMAVSKGQTEAAFALGLQPARTMNLVILPQALRVIIPPLISQYLNLTKNSSLAIAVGYMDATGTLGGITLNQTGKEMETLLLLMAFYLAISLSISFVMNLYNESVKLVERTSAVGFGLSVASLFGGKWELMKRGDAKMHPQYGVTGPLNFVVLFYALWFLALLHFVFIDQGRDSYYTWASVEQIMALLMILSAGAVLATAMLKGSSFIDLACVELVVFVIAVLLAFPMGEVVTQFSSMIVTVGGVAVRLATIGYLGIATRPNITYLNRIREGAR